ncbi:hypothetical protein BCT86_08985 [Vibrio breoganii]|uniref:hypothetical protein n=1 Tax=Vibrio breoganii TaxID=553239 RepID=UPI000C860E5B|nr:hypothetical protein [Vibrio breoganii]MDN3717276.1 hypothetical protein [Vibrio breoganii]PMF63852.1 hypothetical protein BCV08_19225 [Vibrio breoganii]PMJ48095.1 hypothetical protein BCU21_05345 [Vibrio breoganii]PMK57631.1 hypothetical protein BCT97_09510 [Vibrio breoganii]PML08010.1 hypothetical protein BCT86_08985 [Vibrio breoganii]
MQIEETQNFIQPLKDTLADFFFYLAIIWGVVMILGYALLILKRHLEVIKEQKIMHNRHDTSHHK